MDGLLYVSGASVITESIKLIINTWLKPKLEESLKKRKIEKLFMEDISSLFYEYLNRTYKRQKNMSILALGMQQVEIDQIYVPLTVYSERKERVTINEYDINFAQKYKKILIEDTAGMGKSTILKKLFISCIEKNINIPIYIELKHLDENKDIIDEIIEDFNPVSGEALDKDFIKELIARGDFTFFLDGYDEIALEKKEVVTIKLQKFLSKADSNVFFLTSRHEESLISFGQFQRFQIAELEKIEAYELLKKYDMVTELNIYDDLKKQIQENISQKAFAELDSFLGNPLLVSLLYLTFKLKKDIPSSKNDFYRKVYDSLYEEHDLTKDSYKREKYSKLSCSDLQKILMRFSFICLTKNINIYNKDELMQYIREAKRSPYFTDFKEDDIFNDITKTVPLIASDGIDYKWTHKSFMEYFAALYVNDSEKKDKILEGIRESRNFPTYLNMLDFYYGLNQQIFDKIFLRPILNEFIEYIESSESGKREKAMRYIEMIFNKGVFATNRYDDLHDLFRNNDKTLLYDTVKEYYPAIERYRLIFSSFDGTTRTCGFLFAKNNNIELVLRLLYIRKNNIIEKVINKHKGIKLNDEFFSYETPVGEDYNAKINYMCYVFSGMSEFNTMLYINYVKAKKYIKMIEEETKQRKEEDAFLNL